MQLLLIRFSRALEHRPSAITAPQIQTFFQREKSEKAKYFLPGNSDSVQAKLLRVAGHVMYGWSLRMCFSASVVGGGEQHRHRMKMGTVDV